MRYLLLMFLLIIIPAHAELIKIKWHAGDSIGSAEPWMITAGGGFINGWSKNFMDGTVEEHRKTASEGFLNAEILKPKGAKGPIPFVVLLHGCSGMNSLLWKWARSYANEFVSRGYGALILDSFTTRNVANICKDPSQLGWARRRADDAYSALEFLIGNGHALPTKVFVVGRSNGATTSLIIMNQKIGELHKYRFAGAFLLQPSCLYMRTVEFYGPLHLFLAEQDDATSPKLCLAMVKSPRKAMVEAKIFPGAFHGFEDKVPPHKFNGWRMGYNADAANGTINRILAELGKATHK